MYVVRPVEVADIGALEAMAAASMPGVHTLPRTREGIHAVVERSIASFAAHVDIPSEESYLFVLEDLRTREVLGMVHTSTQPARRLLEQEGMHYEGYVDIFDAGPVLQGRVSDLRAVRESVLAVADEGTPEGDTEHMLVSNTQLDNFRMILTRAVPGSGRVLLSAQEMAQLHLRAGDTVRTLTLTPRKNANG